MHILYLTHTSDMVGVMSLSAAAAFPFIKKSKLYQTIPISTDTSSTTANSCGLHSDDLWQMDLIHIYSFGCFTSVPVLYLFSQTLSRLWLRQTRLLQLFADTAFSVMGSPKMDGN